MITSEYPWTAFSVIQGIFLECVVFRGELVVLKSCKFLHKSLFHACGHTFPGTAAIGPLQTYS